MFKNVLDLKTGRCFVCIDFLFVMYEIFNELSTTKITIDLTIAK